MTALIIAYALGFVSCYLLLVFGRWLYRRDVQKRNRGVRVD